MNGIGTFGQNKSNVVPMRTLEEHVAQGAADTARNNAGAWGKASWEIDAALANVRRQKAEGTPETVARATAYATQVMQHVERWMAGTNNAGVRNLVYRAYADTLK